VRGRYNLGFFILDVMARTAGHGIAGRRRNSHITATVDLLASVPAFLCPGGRPFPSIPCCRISVSATDAIESESWISMPRYGCNAISDP
jgi:hypothetical protein